MEHVKGMVLCPKWQDLAGNISLGAFPVVDIFASRMLRGGAPYYFGYVVIVRPFLPAWFLSYTKLACHNRPGVVAFKRGICLLGSLRSPHSKHIYHLEREYVALGERPGRPSHKLY